MAQKRKENSSKKIKKQINKSIFLNADLKLWLAVNQGPWNCVIFKDIQGYVCNPCKLVREIASKNLEAADCLI